MARVSEYGAKSGRVVQSDVRGRTSRWHMHCLLPPSNPRRCAGTANWLRLRRGQRPGLQQQMDLRCLSRLRYQEVRLQSSDSAF